jgi:hypothetical protein
MKSGMMKPEGTLSGDDKAMPDKGTETGSNGDSYGADLGQSSTNSAGGIGGSTKSDRGDLHRGSAEKL